MTFNRSMRGSSRRHYLNEAIYMRLALGLARRGYGHTSPNPMVGAVLVKAGKVIGRGWHRRAGKPHAEIEALRAALLHGHSPKGATLYVTMEPCCTHGRTLPCTEAIIAAGIKRVVVGAVDPNPRHCGKAFAILKRAGVPVAHGLLANECNRLNEAFNHWIVHRTPFVVVKAAMTLDGKIATASGESKWITGAKAREYGMRLRQGADAILVGINTVLADDPKLTVRATTGLKPAPHKRLQRIILDPEARTPLTTNVMGDQTSFPTTIVVAKTAPKRRVAALRNRARVLVAPARRSDLKSRNSNSSRLSLDLTWLLKKLGSENVTSLLVDGGGQTNASFLMQSLANRVAFLYAPRILGGRGSRRGVSGIDVARVEDAIQLDDVRWQPLGPDLLLSARVK